MKYIYIYLFYGVKESKKRAFRVIPEVPYKLWLHIFADRRSGKLFLLTTTTARQESVLRNLTLNFQSYFFRVKKSNKNAFRVIPEVPHKLWLHFADRRSGMLQL